MEETRNNATNNCFGVVLTWTLKSPGWPHKASKVHLLLGSSVNTVLSPVLYIFTPLKASSQDLNEKNDLVLEKHWQKADRTVCFQYYPVKSERIKTSCMQPESYICTEGSNPFSLHFISLYWQHWRLLHRACAQQYEGLPIGTQHPAVSPCSAAASYLQCLRRHFLLKCSWIQIYAGSQFHFQLGREGTGIAGLRHPQTRRIF